MKLRILAALALASASLQVPMAAAADEIQTSWAAWINTTKLSDSTTLISDVQLRSTDDWDSVRTVLLRAGLLRPWGKHATISAGYAYIETINQGGPDTVENRLWQQVIVQKPVRGLPLTHRFRLEQRFIERTAADDVYSDRFRYFARLLVPLDRSGGGTFAQGNFVALQNEIFLNLSGRDDLNGQVFDQNRAYIAVGRRLSSGLDVEVGYMNQHIAGRNRDTHNHIVQFALYTRW
jgi:hypothetical protein